MQTLESLSRQELMSSTDGLVAKERELTAELIRMFREIERRRLHLEMGFGSMFELLTKHFRYSEGAADRRLSAMRLVREVPEVLPALEAGTLSLSTASQVQHFFRNEQKAGKTYTPTEKADLTRKIQGMSRRECERELLALSPESVIPQERERAVTPTETEIRFIAHERLMGKLERLRELFSHHGALGYAELIERLADQALKKLDPEPTPPAVLKEPQTPSQARPPSNPPPAESPKASRSPSPPRAHRRPQVRIEDRRAVFARAGWRCEYIDPLSGRRCSSKWALEVDHRVPLAKGGRHERSNFRLTCKAHNAFLAIQELGLPLMSRYLDRAQKR